MLFSVQLRDLVNICPGVSFYEIVTRERVIGILVSINEAKQGTEPHGVDDGIVWALEITT